jgi:hypothetical protein
MGYLASLAAAIAALAFSSVAPASGSVAGTYTTTVASPAQFKGKWALVLAKGGAFAVKLDGQVVARGKYTSTPTTITFGRELGSPCAGAGTYAWKKSGKTMTFVKKREAPSCQGRALVLGHRFRRAR